MENLFIEGTDTLPTVSLNTTGEIKIEGRALMEDAFKFFQPILSWVEEFNCAELKVDVNMEYFNTSVSKQLHDLFQALEDNKSYQNIQLFWHFEEGDDDMEEAGEIYEELFSRIEFTYKQYDEILE